MFVLAFVEHYVKPIVNVALTLKSSLSHTITEVDVAVGGSGRPATNTFTGRVNTQLFSDVSSTV